MQVLLVLLAIAALSILASSRTVLIPGRFPAVDQLVASGLLFVGVGAAVGPDFLGVFSRQELLGLRPLLALGLGVSGVLVGLNLEPRVLRQLPREVYMAALAHAGTAFLWVALPLVGPLLLTLGLPLGAAVGAAALLGAAASLSSGHFALLSYRHGKMDRRTGLSVALLTMLDDGVGLGVLMLALSFGAAEHPWDGVRLVGLTLLLGVGCGGLLAFLLHELQEQGELMAVLLGGLALVSGAAAYLRLSALLAGVACGATLALVGSHPVQRAVRVLERFERPAYLTLIFLVGAHVQARDVMAWALMPGYLGLRFVGKVLGGALAQRIAGSTLALPPRLGYALIAQGGLALCLVVEYLVLVPGPLSQHVFDVVVVGALFNEVLGGRAFRHALAARGGTP